MIIVVEGNIGAGKTTLCRALAEMCGFVHFEEPAVRCPYLDLYYADPVTWAFQFQTWMLNARVDMHVRASRADAAKGNAGILLDRSVFGDVVFAHNGCARGDMSLAEGQTYTSMWYNLVTEGFEARRMAMPALFVFLDPDPESCLDRVRLRGRGCEAGVDLRYLSGLTAHMHRWFHQVRADHPEMPYVRLTWEDYGGPDGAQRAAGILMRHVVCKLLAIAAHACRVYGLTKSANMIICA